MIKELVIAPNDILRQECQEIANPDSDEWAYLVQDLGDSFDSHDWAVGLAANQIGYPHRALVVDTGEAEGRRWFMFNPIITRTSKMKIEEEEACGSLPGVTVVVPRHFSVMVEWFCPIQKKEQTKLFAFFEARVVQHEIDHLNGKLITDYA